MHIPFRYPFAQSVFFLLLFCFTTHAYTPITFNSTSEYVWNSESFYYNAAKQELLNAGNVEEIDNALLAIFSFEQNYYKPYVLDTLLQEVEEYRAYYASRVNDRFDYTELTKGLGLGALTALVAYGMYAIHKKWYKPNEQLKNKALSQLETMGIKKYEYTEYYFDHAVQRTEFWGQWDQLMQAHSKVAEWRNLEHQADSARAALLASGMLGIVSGLGSWQYVYRGLATDCKKEYERFCLIKSRIELIQANSDQQW